LNGAVSLLLPAEKIAEAATKAELRRAEHRIVVDAGLNRIVAGAGEAATLPY